MSLLGAVMQQERLVAMVVSFVRYSKQHEPSWLLQNVCSMIGQASLFNRQAVAVQSAISSRECRSNQSQGQG